MCTFSLKCLHFGFSWNKLYHIKDVEEDMFPDFLTVREEEPRLEVLLRKDREIPPQSCAPEKQ
jgi:hypothetical protein